MTSTVDTSTHAVLPLSMSAILPSTQQHRQPVPAVCASCTLPVADLHPPLACHQCEMNHESLAVACSTNLTRDFVKFGTPRFRARSEGPHLPWLYHRSGNRTGTGLAMRRGNRSRPTVRIQSNGR